MTETKTKTEPKAPEATAEELEAVLKRLPDRELQKARIKHGTAFPRLVEGSDQEVRIFGYLCKHCTDIGLEFLGNSWEVWADRGGSGKTTVQSFAYPPTHVPFAELRWVQDGPASPGGRLYKSRSKSEPVCQYCGNALALGKSGGIKESRVVKLSEWRELRAEELRRKEQPAFSYQRDARPKPWAKASPGKSAE